MDTVTQGVRAGRTSGLGNVVVASEALTPNRTAAHGGLLRGYVEGTHQRQATLFGRNLRERWNSHSIGKNGIETILLDDVCFDWCGLENDAYTKTVVA